MTYARTAPNVVETKFMVFLSITPRRSRVAPSTLSTCQPRKPMAIGISRYHDASGIVGMTVRFHTRERYERTSQPATDVYAAAPNAHSWPSRETPPSVPGGTGSPVVMRTVFRESTPISLARVSAPATDRAERKMTPLMIFGKPAGIVSEIAATAMGANPFAITFVDFRSPRTPSWTPNASFKANR